jgi:hypothetical protein
MSAHEQDERPQEAGDEASEGTGIDLSSILVIDRRILGGDSDPATELTRQMSAALDGLTVQEWELLGQLFEHSAA